MSEKETPQTSAARNVLTANVGAEHKELLSKLYDAGAEIHTARAKEQEGNAKLAKARAELARAGLLIDRHVIGW
jgi:hypothetical protein